MHSSYTQQIPWVLHIKRVQTCLKKRHSKQWECHSHSKWLWLKGVEKKEKVILDSCKTNNFTFSKFKKAFLKSQTLKFKK